MPAGSRQNVLEILHETTIFCLPQPEPQHEAVRSQQQVPACENKLLLSLHTESTLAAIKDCWGGALTTNVHANKTAAVPPINAPSSANWNTSTALACTAV